MCWYRSVPSAVISNWPPRFKARRWPGIVDDQTAHHARGVSHKPAAIADTPEQSANLRARAELIQRMGARLKKHVWTQAEAASRCGVTQPQLNDLLCGRVSRFSLDALVNIATALGWRVRGDLDAA